MTSASPAIAPPTWFVGIDYSGEGNPTHSCACAVYEIDPVGNGRCVPPERAGKPTGHAGWHRRELARWLLRELEVPGRRIIVGIDHCFSLPISYFNLPPALRNWDALLVEVTRTWRTLAAKSEVRNTVGNDPRGGSSSEYRMAEQWAHTAKSAFDFGGVGVAHSTHAGIPFLLWLRKKCKSPVHFWPFDGFAAVPDKHLIVEAYPALWSRRFIKPPGTSEHQRDAFFIAQWLYEVNTRGLLDDYVDLPRVLRLTASEQDQVMKEGWIIGVR